MILTEKQQRTIDDAKTWYMNDSLTIPFIILGCAGSGKSTIIKFLIDNIGIHPTVNVKYLTFTGKAASVLIKKGNPATTIHKLIYDPVFDEKGNIERFILKKSLNPEIKLLVVDEFYMVNNDIMKDLLSFGIKTICLGDSYQLPPPLGEANELSKIPSAILSEPLRQSLDNPIIYLAEQARNHKFIKLGNYGDNVKVIRKSELDLNAMVNSDQIIAGKNITVKQLNKFYRKNFLNIPKDSWIPHKGEKLICLKNNWKENCSENNINTNLVNGLSCIVENDLEVISSTYHSNIKLRPEFFENSTFYSPVDMLYFKNDFTTDKELYDKNNINKLNYEAILKKRKMFFEGKDINKFTFGYAITCHKSQGSEWDDVFFIFEPFKGYKDPLYWQMLYTGITRASKKLTIAI